jgi:hypothetical protein
VVSTGGCGGFHSGIGGFHLGIGGLHLGIGGFHLGIGGFHWGTLWSPLADVVVSTQVSVVST